MMTLTNESRGAQIPGNRPSIEVSYETLLAVGVFLSIVAIISTLGNGSFLAVLVRRRAWCRRDAHLILLLAMACSDLGITIFGYPYTIVSCFMGSWAFGEFFCKMYAFMCYTLSMVSACILVVISVFRYIIICKPQSKHRLTPRLSCMCILGTICYVLIWTLTPFFGWSSYTYEPFGASCSFDWYDSSIGGVTYAIATTIFCYLLPLTIMGVCYHKIHRRVSQLKLDPVTPPPPLPCIDGDADDEASASSNHQSISALEGSETIRRDCALRSTRGNGACLNRYCFDAALIFDFGLHHHTNRRTYKVEIQVLKLNVLMVVTFFIIWSPYAILSIITLYYPDLPAFWYIFPTVFAKTSCMMNPLLYGLTNASLRRQFQLLWSEVCCYCSRKHKMEHHDLQDHFRKGTDGERAVYDKEGLYLGKVNQGTCMCSGCIQSRREVEMLIRLQTRRNRDSEVHTTSLVISQPVEENGIGDCAQQQQQST